MCVMGWERKQGVLDYRDNSVPTVEASERDRLLVTLQQLLAIAATTVPQALEQAADLVAQALGTDKVDVFLHDADRGQLVAFGVSDTPMGRREREIGMDILPLDSGERIVEVFQSGVSYRTGHAEQDSSVSDGFSQGLGIHSMLAVPLDVAGERRGVLAIDAADPDVFSAADLRFFEAVARWVGLVMHRAELAERVARDAAQRAERAAAEAEHARLEGVLEQLPIGVAIAEVPSGKLLFHNAEAIRLLRHPLLESPDVASYARYGALHPSGEPYTPEEYPIARAVLTGEVVPSEEMQYRRGDGTTAIFEVTAAPIHDTAGEVVLAVSTFTDISARKRAEAEREEARAEAEAAVRVRDDFLAGATHDLRSPLTSLRGRTQLIRRRLDRGQTPDPRWLLEQVDIVDASTRRMLATVNELSDVARLQIGQTLQLEMDPVDLGALARAVAEEMTSGQQRVAVAVEAPDNPVIVEGDGARLQRVLQNIVDNAVKYSPAGSPVRVTVEEDAQREYATITVHDEGVGIPAEDLPRVFTRYYRAATAHGIAGSGLGLSGARAIVEQHGGSIAIESAVGRGTTVILTLPHARPS